MPLTGIYQPSTSSWARDQAELYEKTAGGEGGDLQGRPIIVLTTVGARSGALRKTALMRVEHEGVYAVIASRGGAPAHPAWYWNLSANHIVELQDGAVTKEYVAREVSGHEREIWWARACEAWPPYAEYQEKTERVIPVVLLEERPAE